MNAASSIYQNLRLSEKRRVLPQPGSMASAAVRSVVSGVAVSGVTAEMASQPLQAGSAVMPLGYLSSSEQPQTSSFATEIEQRVNAAWAQGRQEGFEAGQREAADTARVQVEQTLELQLQQRLQVALEEVKRRVQADFSVLEKEMGERIKRVGALSDQLSSGVERQMDLAEDEMLSLVFDVICRILGDKAVQLDGLRGYLDQSLRSWRGHAALSLHLNPDDLNLLLSDPEHEQWVDRTATGHQRGILKWVADTGVQLGGCLLRSSEGALDMRLETQLRQLSEMLSRTREDRRQSRTNSVIESAST
ncbi:MAG: hypothetical protein JOY84_21770 [Curvibacter sp.]|nr:hypothetical protein [Curvibacter sp.]